MIINAVRGDRNSRKRYRGKSDFSKMGACPTVLLELSRIFRELIAQI